MSRVYLRPLTENDVNQNYLEGFSDDVVLEFLEVDGKSLTKDDVVEYIHYGRKTKSYFMYAICLVENDKQVGNLKIGPINYKHMTSGMPIVIWDKEQWGKGLATEAIREGNRLAFEKYNIRKLSGAAYSDNIGSIKAFTKSGWVIEGRLSNHFILNGKLQNKIMFSCFNPYYKE